MDLKVHVVKKGEPLWLIGREHGLSINKLIEDNYLENINGIVPGQALLVEEEEGRFRIEEFSREAAIHGCFSPLSGKRIALESIDCHFDYYTPDIYRVDKKGNIINPHEGMKMPRLVGKLLLNISREGENGLEILNSDEGAFFGNFKNSVLERLRTGEFCGININFSRFPEAYSEEFLKVLWKIKEQTFSSGLKIVVSLPPMEDGENNLGREKIDCLAFNEIADFFIITCGEWGWQEGPPMSPAPIDKLRRAIEYLLEKIPCYKIIPTLPLYGLDWRLPYSPSGYPAIRVSYPQVIMLASKYLSEINYDDKSCSCSFRYIEENNEGHEIWFEDIRSIGEKLSLIEEYGLGGLNLSGIEYNFPQALRIIFKYLDKK
jgi:spore germination protein